MKAFNKGQFEAEAYLKQYPRCSQADFKASGVNLAEDAYSRISTRKDFVAGWTSVTRNHIFCMNRELADKAKFELEMIEIASSIDRIQAGYERLFAMGVKNEDIHEDENGLYIQEIFVKETFTVVFRALGSDWWSETTDTFEEEGKAVDSASEAQTWDNEDIFGVRNDATREIIFETMSDMEMREFING